MNKIEALKKTIYNLENNTYLYSWHNSDTCNCGILAKTVLNTGKDETLWNYGIANVPSCTNDRFAAFSKKAHCMTTGIKLPKVFQALKDAGFTFEDVNELEQCTNLEVLTRMGRKEDRRYHSEKGYYYNPNKSSKWYLIEYLSAWVEILEEKEKQQLPTVSAVLVTWKGMVEEYPVHAN